jgi:hypothetical protein
MAKDQDHAPISFGGLAIFLGTIPQQAACMHEERQEQLIHAISAVVRKILFGPISGDGEAPKTELSANVDLMRLGLAFDASIPIACGLLIVLLIDKNIYFSFVDRSPGTFDDDPTSPKPPRTPPKNQSTPSEFVRAVDRTLRHELSPIGGRVLNLSTIFSDQNLRDIFTRPAADTMADAEHDFPAWKHVLLQVLDLRLTFEILISVAEEKNNDEVISVICRSKSFLCLFFVALERVAEMNIVLNGLSFCIVDGQHRVGSLYQLLCDQERARIAPSDKHRHHFALKAMASRLLHPCASMLVFDAHRAGAIEVLGLAGGKRAFKRLRYYEIAPDNRDSPGSSGRPPGVSLSGANRERRMLLDDGCLDPALSEMGKSQCKTGVFTIRRQHDCNSNCGGDYVGPDFENVGANFPVWMSRGVPHIRIELH